jgi:2-polyprenyl-6-hydroxyphenyl methylase/3-demethylubiquinone-9 3-methyltransferase
LAQSQGNQGLCLPCENFGDKKPLAQTSVYWKYTHLVSKTFRFGKNWKTFNLKSDLSHIEHSQKSLDALIGKDVICNKTVLDIGCGSGIHALSFLRAGAKYIKCIDLDPDAVETTVSRLEEYNPDKWNAQIANILDVKSNSHEFFDIVFSWGVLHHSGNLMMAIKNSADFCKDGSLLILAIYRRTSLCTFWKIEKKIYNIVPSVFRRIIDLTFACVFLFAKWTQGNSPRAFVKNYRMQRGMDFMTDIRDWLGGYPYESASPATIHNFLTVRGFNLIKSNIRDQQFGFLGSGCNEYIYELQKESLLTK